MPEYILTVKAKDRKTILRIIDLIEGDGISEHENISITMEAK